MAYTKVNWVDGTTTPISAVNLNNMDEGIDNNDGRVTNIESGTTQTNANQYKGNDIDSDGDGKVNSAEQADNADLLNGKDWELVASGNLTVTANFFAAVNLLTAQQHHMYNFDVYSPSRAVTYGGTAFLDVEAVIVKQLSGSDYLNIENKDDSDHEVYYQIYAWK